MIVAFFPGLGDRWLKCIFPHFLSATDMPELVTDNQVVFPMQYVYIIDYQ